MSREQVADAIGWSYIIWTFGMLNVAAMLPQIIQIIRTREVEGLSLGMFFLYLAIQVAFSLHGLFMHDDMLMVSRGLSALVTASVIVLVIRFRYRTKTSSVLAS